MSCCVFMTELCLTSNLKCNTVKTLTDHHLAYWMEKQHPVALSVSSSVLDLFFSTMYVGYKSQWYSSTHG